VGTDAFLLSGANIGQGAVIGARAVVSKPIPPYAVVVGNPARIIRYRFSEEIIEKLLRIDFSSLDADFFSTHLEEFYTPIADASMLDFLEKEG
jgi:serine acetyltransferase